MWHWKARKVKHKLLFLAFIFFFCENVDRWLMPSKIVPFMFNFFGKTNQRSQPLWRKPPYFEKFWACYPNEIFFQIFSIFLFLKWNFIRRLFFRTPCIDRSGASKFLNALTEKLFFFSIQYYRITSHHSPMQIFLFKKISDKNVCSAKKPSLKKKKKIPKVCVNSSIF